MLAGVALWGFLFLILTLSYDAKGAIDGDVMIFLSIGRGMQNGLRIYRDLFESKPPGIFLLSWLSLWLTNGTALMRVVQDIGLLAVPVILTYVSRPRLDRLCCAFIFGCLISLWSYGNSAGLETELYGLLPMTLYAVLITSPMTRMKIYLAGGCVFWATFFKEPYILGTLAAAMLVSRTPKEFLERFVYPSLIAAGLTVVALFWTGTFMPYVTVYLPGMLQDRIHTSDSGPLLLRALWVQRLFSSLTIYSSIPLLGYFLTGLWIFATVTKVRSNPLLCTMALLIGAWGMGKYWIFLTIFYTQRLHGLGWWTTASNPTAWGLEALFLGGTVLYVLFLIYLWRKNPRLVFRVCISLLILPLLGLTISLGGFGHRYLLYLLPVILVLFLMALENNIILATVTAILLITSRAPREDFLSIAAFHQNRELSVQLDKLMDSCGYATYAMGGKTPVFAFARHSPIGPLFVFSAHTYLGYHHPLYEETIRNIVQQPVLIVEYPLDENAFPAVLRNEFQAPVPACATPIQGFMALFRTPSH